ncbi:hypothetical protein FNV43_RR04602 [Rhamnella rubrinervis]|uniref:NB-ARC domain-containing protein n=1 Tax=Rhamnella rubrinervis TaxID=2594499 RepID=A0A8K0HM34_9ROSA|nr:hypothetical protein FNV43_RR04602 [Rhamnella rubrinervis]
MNNPQSDDIWDKLDLEDVGISFGIHQRECKILLTTRSFHVLANDMDVDRNVIFAVRHLLEHEAMSLFHKIVGDQDEKDDDFQDSTAVSLYGIGADQCPQTLKTPELKLLRVLSTSVIEPNVISRLTRLEELNLKDSFTNWQVEGAINDDERRNASLSEVKNLSHLIDLKLRVPDINSVTKDIFGKELVKYYVCIGDEEPDWRLKRASRMLKLKLRPGGELNEHDFEALLKKSETLDLYGLKSVKSIAFEIDSMGFQCLKHLSVQYSDEIRCIVNSDKGIWIICLQLFHV